MLADPATSEGLNPAVSNVHFVTKDFLSQNSSSKLNDHSENEGMPVPASSSKTFPELIKNRSVDDKTSLAMSTKESVAPVVHSSGSFPSSTTAEGLSTSNDHTAAAITLIPQSIPSFSVIPQTSQSATPCPSESTQVKRPDRKTPCRVEGPRRRGKKQALALSSIQDGLPSQEPKSSSQTQGDMLGSKAAAARGKHGTETQEVITVIEPQIGGAHLSGGLVAHDPRRKEQASHNPQIKQPMNLPLTVDTASVSSDKHSAPGQVQTADVNDVARVMKEVFSGTRSSKGKNVDSSGKESKVVPNIPVTNKTTDEVAKNQNLGDKAHLTTVISGKATSVLTVKHGVKSGTTSATTKVDGTSFSNETHVLMTNRGDPENAAGSFQNMEDWGTGDMINASITEVHNISSQHDCSHDSPVVIKKADDVGDRFNVIQRATESPRKSSLVEPPLKVEPNSGEETVPASEESLKSSHDTRSVESSITTTVTLHLSPEKSNLEAPCGEDARQVSVHAIVVKSCNNEHKVSDVGVPIPPQIEHGNDVRAEVCNTKVDPSEGNEMNVHMGGSVSGIVPLSSLAAVKKKFDYSKSSSLDSAEALVETKGSDVKHSDQLNVSESGSSLHNISEVLSSSVLETGKEKAEDSSEKVPFCSSQPREEPEGYLAKMDVQSDSAKDSGILPKPDILHSSLKTGEKTECLSKAFGEPKGSDAEPSYQLDDSERCEFIPEKNSEALPSSVSVRREQKVCSPVLLSDLESVKELKDSEAEVHVQSDSSKGDGILAEFLSEPASSFGAGQKTEYPSENRVICNSNPSEVPKETETKIPVQPKSSKDVEASQKIVPEPMSSLVTVEEKIGISPQQGHSCNTEPHEEPNFSEEKFECHKDPVVSVQTNSSQVGRILQENVESDDTCHLSCSVVEEKKTEGLCGKDPVGTVVISNVVPVQTSQLDASQVDGFGPEKFLQTVILSSSALSNEEEKIKGSAKESLDSSAALDELENNVAGFTHQVNGVDAPQIGGFLPEDTFSDNAIPLPSPVTHEEKMEESSKNYQISSSAGIVELKASGSKLDDKIDPSQVGLCQK